MPSPFLSWLNWSILSMFSLWVSSCSNSSSLAKSDCKIDRSMSMSCLNLSSLSFSSSKTAFSSRTRSRSFPSLVEVSWILIAISSNYALSTANAATFCLSCSLSIWISWLRFSRIRYCRLSSWSSSAICFFLFSMSILQLWISLIKVSRMSCSSSCLSRFLRD